MNWYKQNIAVYDSQAQRLAEYYRSYEPRRDDIKRALELASKTNHDARVIEIGCGDGRDATEILKQVAWYEGIDPAQGILDIARQYNPDGNFVLADALTYQFPTELDIIFAFASLLHVNRGDLSKVFEKAAQALRVDGIFYINLKERADYEEDVKEDTYGERMFYYYNAALLTQIAGSNFTLIYEAHPVAPDGTAWLTVAFKKA